MTGTELTDSVVAVALIPVDEPVFVLRASDPAAAELVTQWSEMTLARTGDAQLARIGFDQAHAMRLWRRAETERLAARILQQAAEETHQTPIPGLGVSEAGK